MNDKLAAGEGPLTLGLDIGIASVGWAVLSPQRIIALGVRAFDKAETADKGEPLNLTRRTARLTRRRLWRRAWRLTKLGRLLKRHGLIPEANYFKKQPTFSDSTWRLRVEGLDRRLEPQEWARVIYHLCKHRGFHWASRAEEKQADADAKGEGGRVKAGLRQTRSLMEEKNYRSPAEMLLAEFPDAQRNKQGDYAKALSRRLLDDELGKLFAAQRQFGNPNAGADLEAALRGEGDGRGLLWEQRPVQSVVGRMGKCTFEPGEDRAPKHSFTAERHVWLTRLNNLRVSDAGHVRALDAAERAVALNLPYLASSDKFTYRHLRTALTKAGLWTDAIRFNGLSYPSEKEREEQKARNPEEQVLVRLPGWQILREALKEAGLETQWQLLSLAAIEGRGEVLDEIARILSVYKNDDEIRAAMLQVELPGHERTLEALLGVRFDKFHALSLKALQRIVPLMEGGMRYDEAVASIPEYGHHSQRFVVGGGSHKYLPPFYAGRNERGTMTFREGLNAPRNPVVLRSLNQARKVVNALVRSYGAPAAVHIEMARDLSRNLDERRDIEKLQQEFRGRNDAARDHFAELFGRRPTGLEFEKWLLYREQEGKCAYSLTALDCERVINDPNYAQVDHALPYSRSYDDSRNNRVLVLTRENQNKGNRTPHEYLDGESDSERWRNFAAWVGGNKNYRQAKRNRLLRKNFGPEEASSFRDRNLNDTRYICRFFKNYVEQHLQLADGSESRRCVVLSGQLTSFLRARWGLVKIRDESDRHHALDAAIVAACSHAMVKRLADHARLKELEYLREGFPDPETGEIINPEAHRRLSERFPEPWPYFRQELEARIKCFDADALRQALGALGTYPSDLLQGLRPLFVSRAPQRRNGGAVHKETIYKSPQANHGGAAVVQKVPLTALTLKDLDRLVDPHRNEKLYALIRTRLEAHGGKAEKAFGPENPLRKPSRSGEQTGPLVRSVRLVIDKMSGVPVRGGIAKNDAMLRVDVFARGGKFYLVPVYVHHRVKGLPDRAIAAYKGEDDWPRMENEEFCFSLHPNDLVEVVLKDERHLGYYAGCDRSTGAISLWAHDRHSSVGKDGLIRGIGAKTARSIRKFNVDVLGNVYPAAPEPRRGLA